MRLGRRWKRRAFLSFQTWLPAQGSPFMDGSFRTLTEVVLLGDVVLWFEPRSILLWPHVWNIYIYIIYDRNISMIQSFTHRVICTFSELWYTYHRVSTISNSWPMLFYLYATSLLFWSKFQTSYLYFIYKSVSISLEKSMNILKIKYKYCFMFKNSNIIHSLILLNFSISPLLTNVMFSHIAYQCDVVYLNQTHSLLWCIWYISINP